MHYLIKYNCGYKVQTSKHKKTSNFTVHWGHQYKKVKKQLRVVAYTCRYSTGHLLLSLFHSSQNE